MTHHIELSSEATNSMQATSSLFLQSYGKLLFNEYNFKGDVYYTHHWGRGHYITFIKYDEWSAKEQVHVEYILGKGVGEFSLSKVYTGWDLKDSK